MIFNLRQRQCKNANAFDTNQADRSREMTNTYARIVASFCYSVRMREQRDCAVEPLHDCLLLRDTYRAHIYVYCIRTHHWARSQSGYLKPYTLARCYVHETIFLLFLFCTCFVCPIPFRCRSHALLLPFNGRCSQPCYYTANSDGMRAYTLTITYMHTYRCVTLKLFRMHAYVCACVRIMVEH